MQIGDLCSIDRTKVILYKSPIQATVPILEVLSAEIVSFTLVFGKFITFEINIEIEDSKLRQTTSDRHLVQCYLLIAKMKNTM